MRKSERLMAPEADKSKQKNVARNTMPKSILESFEYIVELAENSNLDAQFFGEAGMHIRYAVRKLQLTPTEVVLLAIFVDRSEDSRIMLSEIASYTGCRTTKMLRYMNHIEHLEELHYLRVARTKDSLSFRVPHEVLEALANDRPYVHTYTPVLDTPMFFDLFSTMMDEKDDDELQYHELFKRTLDMLDEIKDTVFVRELNSLRLESHIKLLFIYMAFLFVENNDNCITLNDIRNLYDRDELPVGIKQGLRNHNNPLFDRGVIENVNEDGMARSDAFKLTDKAKREILAEFDLLKESANEKDLIQYDTLTKKSLVYNPTEKSQVGQLTSILAKKQFEEVQERLLKAGMRKGFCCLFYGAPGTGKTETVYQLARRTGRDILRVDVDKIKSCWVGESEKNIKEVFQKYRIICKNRPVAPILLFNEADAVLGIRMESAKRAIDKMENSIQNIILQEMETIDGIMIATTNLTSNLDKAFERRFLYKIRFEKPSIEARTKIWQTMLKGLKKKDAKTLASMFDLSGGEIENIVRKHSVNAILSGKEIIDLPSLIEICKHERINDSSNIHIGFQ